MKLQKPIQSGTPQSVVSPTNKCDPIGIPLVSRFLRQPAISNREFPSHSFCQPINGTESDPVLSRVSVTVETVLIDSLLSVIHQSEGWKFCNYFLLDSTLDYFTSSTLSSFRHVTVRYFGSNLIPKKCDRIPRILKKTIRYT